VSGRWERARAFGGEEGASEEALGGGGELSVRESKSFVSRLLEGALFGVNSIKR